jgi:hypothetical protein
VARDRRTRKAAAAPGAAGDPPGARAVHVHPGRSAQAAQARALPVAGQALRPEGLSAHRRLRRCFLNHCTKRDFPHK